MKRNWMAVLVLAGGLESAMFGQQYPQQYPQQNRPYQGDPNYNGQGGNGQYNNGQYDNGQYAGDPRDGAYNGDQAYDDNDQGVYAPAPPPIPSYAYDRPLMPGPGYYWVDGYWNFLGGRYSWVGGYWSLPPYSGGYWVRPRYSSGRFFGGYWGGGRQTYSRGYVNRGYAGNGYRYQGRVQAPRPSYRAPERGRSEFRGGDRQGSRSGNWGHGGRR